MTTILLIRHGESVTNKKRRYTGQGDVPLTELGEAQAEGLVEYIEKHFFVDAVYSSDLIRAVCTIKPFCDKYGFEIKKDKRLRELDVGVWSGKTFEEVGELYAEDHTKWRADPVKNRCTDGESYRDLQNRAIPALLDIAEQNPGKTVAVATHGGLIRTVICKAIGMPLERMADITLCENTSVTVIGCEGGEISLIKATDDSHVIKSVAPTMIH